MQSILAVIKPADIQKAVRIRVRNNLDYQANPEAVLTIISEVGNKWAEVDLERAQVNSESRSNPRNNQEVVHTARAVNLGEVKESKNSKCSHCKSSEHYFLVKKNGVYVQNCPVETGRNYAKLVEDETLKISANQQAYNERRKTKRTVARAYKVTDENDN